MIVRIPDEKEIKPPPFLLLPSLLPLESSPLPPTANVVCFCQGSRIQSRWFPGWSGPSVKLEDWKGGPGKGHWSGGGGVTP